MQHVSDCINVETSSSSERHAVHVSVYVIVQVQMQQFRCVDLLLQGNNGVSGDNGWTYVLLPDVQISTGIWWTSFT
jgi:hypothetical protein